MIADNHYRGALGAYERAMLLVYGISRAKEGSPEWYKGLHDYMKALVRYLQHRDILERGGFKGKLDKLPVFPEQSIPDELKNYYVELHPLVAEHFDPI